MERVNKGLERLNPLEGLFGFVDMPIQGLFGREKGYLIREKDCLFFFPPFFRNMGSKDCLLEMMFLSQAVEVLFSSHS